MGLVNHQENAAASPDMKEIIVKQVNSLYGLNMYNRKIDKLQMSTNKCRLLFYFLTGPIYSVHNI